MGYWVPMATPASLLALEKWVAEEPVVEPKETHVWDVETIKSSRVYCTVKSPVNSEETTTVAATGLPPRQFNWIAEELPAEDITVLK